MSRLLDKAIEKARQLPEAQQEAIGQLVLDEIDDEQAWEEKFEATAPKLDGLAERLRRDHREGKTKPLAFPEE